MRRAKLIILKNSLLDLFKYNLRYLKRTRQNAYLIILVLIYSVAHASPLHQKQLVKPEQAETQFASFTILEEARHNPRSFTQGYDLDNGIFYESSGLYGRSFVEYYSSEKILKHKKLPKRIFSEGLVKVGEYLYVLTWKAKAVLILDAKTLEIIRVIKYDTEGWGITHNGEQFITSDGSSQLSFRDSKLALKRSVTVTDKDKTYSKINELEYAKGYIWANVWLSPYILKIDPETGNVKSTYDLSDLVKINSTRPKDKVLNGLAYDAEKDAFWVTGKLWPKRYLIQFK